MATYTIARRGDDQSGFEVRVVGDDGAHQTLLGFRTRADAHAWVAQDQKPTDVVEETDAHFLPAPEPVGTDLDRHTGADGNPRTCCFAPTKALPAGAGSQ